MNLNIRNGYLMYILSVFIKINLSGFGVTEYSEVNYCLTKLKDTRILGLHFYVYTLYVLGETMCTPRGAHFVSKHVATC